MTPDMFFQKIYSACELGIGVVLGVMLIAFFARKLLYI